MELDEDDDDELAAEEDDELDVDVLDGAFISPAAVLRAARVFRADIRAEGGVPLQVLGAHRLTAGSAVGDRSRDAGAAATFRAATPLAKTRASTHTPP